MKYRLLPVCLALVLFLAGCAPQAEPQQTAVPTTAPTEPVVTTVATEPPTGWQEMNGKRYYLFDDGTHPLGWFEEGGKTYYIAENGFAHTGWLTLQGDTYYFKEDGSMAKGEITLDGVNYHFTSTGKQIIMVNPWNPLPEDYSPVLVTVEHGLGVQGMQVDKRCYDALVTMLTDCNTECPRAVVVSSYRTQEYQQKLFDRKTNYYRNRGLDLEEAKIEAAKTIAVPGTSEHQLGLAVDIVDSRSYSLTEEQADLPAQKWLMENCWRYGFVLRYPADKTDVTGIIYEPWHYRYVGNELAKELYECGLTLEEYIQSITTP